MGPDGQLNNGLLSKWTIAGEEVYQAVIQLLSQIETKYLMRPTAERVSFCFFPE